MLDLRRGGEFVENLLESALVHARLSPPDRRLCQELVYGAVRWESTLDWLIARKTGGRTQKRILQLLLRLGLYQILWLDRIPAHAAVNETVELARKLGFGPQAGFVNALLRGYLREAEATKAALAELKTAQPHLGYSHPEWLVRRWEARWGRDKTAELLAWDNRPPHTFARVNTLKAEAGKLLEQWREEAVEYDFVRKDWLGENLVFELKSHPPLPSLLSFVQGKFYIQDPSTLLAVHELEPKPGERVLDLCAAPGGKLSYIAQFMDNRGQIVAYDSSAARLKMIDENCARLGITCVKTVLAGESLASPRDSTAGLGGPKSEASRFSLFTQPSYDRVLLDAPCSNTGVMRRRVDLRWRIRPEEISRLRTGQLQLLRQAADLLKPGGTMVYSTCSLEPEENRQVIDEFLAGRTEFLLVRDRELRPFVEGVDGAYVAQLRSAKL